MNNKLNLLVFLVGASLGLDANANADGELSEQDFFTDLPVVLSVSRLAQPLSDTPGAVTIIDREMIRRSGARDLSDLMRLVPGFIVAHLEGGARPLLTYHADYDSITRHLQVFIDGRSVYSSLLVGSASYGMMGVVLEDIERIEVLRGSNSAAYGANAFQGVVNIITRHSVDTQGGMVSLSAGDTRLRDGAVRLGWTGGSGTFRLTAASRSDDGFSRVYDSSRLEQVHFRGDLQLSQHDDLTINAGHARFRWGTNDSLEGGHEEGWRNSYAQFAWTRDVDSANQVKVNATADEENFSNYYPLLRADGTSRRLIFEAQHSHVVNPRWRVVWGGQYRQEQVDSPDLFYANSDQRFHLWRVFGNLEWRPHPQWVVNAGGLAERHSIVGDNFAPRLMANYHVLPGHTLRAGMTGAYKLPTLFELRSDWRDAGGPKIQASGQAQPERIDATELGYLGDFRERGVTVDVRVFHERVRDLLRYQKPCGSCVNDLVNKDPNTQRGWEAQLRWQPFPDTQILLNHTELELLPDARSSAPQDAKRAPSRFSTLALFQKLAAGWDLSVIHSTMAPLYWIRKDDITPAYAQTDLRVARGFRLGASKAEAALTVRAVNGEHLDFVERDYPPMLLDRRAIFSLRLDI